MADPDATVLVGLLADAHRRRVVAAVGLNRQQVAKALGKLVESGLIVNSADGLAVAGDSFQHAARLANTRPASTEFADEPDEISKVLRAFVVDGRLQSIPVAASKKMVILDWLVQDFEPGTTYTEKMVNLILGKRHADTAALRRYLVDHGFLDRADGEYWRIGGTVRP